MILFTISTFRAKLKKQIIIILNEERYKNDTAKNSFLKPEDA